MVNVLIQDLLEAPVRWVTPIIIFVFDPIGCIIVDLSQYILMWYRDEKGPNGPSRWFHVPKLIPSIPDPKWIHEEWNEAHRPQRRIPIQKETSN